MLNWQNTYVSKTFHIKNTYGYINSIFAALECCKVKGNNLAHNPLTFLFTDLENSTPLWEKFPDEMQRVSARHDAL